MAQIEGGLLAANIISEKAHNIQYLTTFAKGLKLHLDVYLAKGRYATIVTHFVHDKECIQQLISWNRIVRLEIYHD